jgi:hypothetical protein
MSPAELSIFVFGVFIAAVGGVGFVAMPKIVMRQFGFPDNYGLSVRILGSIIMVLGGYYVVAGLYHLEPLIWASVFGRSLFFLFLAALVLLKQAKPRIILFGVFDAVGALWTILALR